MKKVLFVLMCVCMVSLARADLAIINGTFDGGSSGALDVPDWFDLDNPERGAAFWQTASICTTGVNPFPDDACMMGDAFPSGDADSYIYQAIGTKASCQTYSISIDYAQPTDGNTGRSPWLQVDIFQGSFPGAADDVDIADQGLTLIDSVSSESFPDMDIHNFTSPLDLSLANTTDMLWIRIANLPGQGTDAGSWAVIDNVQIISEPAPCGSAYNPNPADGETDVVYNVIMSWTPGQFADKHDVYIGTDFDDVNNADINSILLVGPGQDVNTYNPGKLEFGQTYYWRVDEINAPSNPGEYKGPIWSFTVEPYSLKIPSENITASASSQSPGQGPEKTIDGSGLTDDLHSTNLTGMWFSQPSDPGQAWIQYDFDRAYQLNEMLVWNYNGQTISSLYGFEAVTVEYSTDGLEWATLENVAPFSPATGQEGYASNITVDFDNVAAKHVKITANNNHGGGVSIFNQYGLSEVRFMYIPVSARKPSPSDGAADVAIDTILSWRAGREAAEHKVYLSTDEQAVTDGTATATTINQTNYNPFGLGIGSTYYWRIDEVNDAEVNTLWEGGVWSFSTLSSLVVEDFESYNDILEGEDGSNLVYLTWIDGYDNPSTNGSTMGYTSGSSLETDITHNDSRYSVPLIYDNSTAGKSTVTVDPGELEIGRDWTVGSPEVLVVHLYGDATNNSATDQLYVSINGKKTVYEGDISRPDWEQFEIDLASLGTNLSNVNNLTIGLEGSGSGMIFLDNIELYRVAPTVEKIWLEAEDADSVTAPMVKFTDDPNASGGQYIGKPDGAGNDATASPAPNATATYTFEIVSGGKYMVGLRVYGYGTSDGFWVRIPGAAAVQTAEGADATLTDGWLDSNNFAEGSYWHWVYAVAGDDDGDPDAIYTLEPGTHTLLISNRDDGTMLDAVSIIKID